jgi:hypothetical protein
MRYWPLRLYNWIERAFARMGPDWSLIVGLSTICLLLVAYVMVPQYIGKLWRGHW